MPITRDDVLERLKVVEDPELRRDLVTLDAVKRCEVEDGGVVRVELSVTSADPAVRQTVRRDAEAAIRSIGPDVTAVHLSFADDKTASGGASRGQTQSGQAGSTQPTGETAQDQNPLPTVKHVIAVGAGKGGVGKSTVAVNLAIGLARAGHAVGLLDGDIYGPSLPTMLGLDDLEVTGSNNAVDPFRVHGIEAMSLGSLVEADKALIWRGPMAHGAFKQLVTQTRWGQLDYLIIDLPPGTGDVPLTMSQTLPLTGAVVVCTPQKVAQDDARRAVAMFQQLGVDVLGIVENMSYFIADDGKEYDLFGRGGAEVLAQKTGLPYLGAIPINPALRRNCDAGDPVANFEQDDQLAAELNAVVRATKREVEVREATVSLPTMNVT